VSQAQSERPLDPLLVSLHDGVRDEVRGDLFPAKPASVESLDRLLGGLDAIKLDVDFTLRERG
jgi:hypothetical protein